MNNWHFLLLAVVVVVQPLGSFTESNLIDGRECCERSEDARFYGYRRTEERRSLIDGIREDRRQTNEELHLSSLDGNHDRSYEARRSFMLTRSKSLEQNTRRNSPELQSQRARRFASDQESRYPDTFAQRRETREEQNRNRDESRSSMVQNERDSRKSTNRNTLDASRPVGLSRDAKDTRSVKRESRNTMSRLPIRTSRSNEERRVSPNGETTILEREREDLVRSDTLRDTNLRASLGRFESRMQLDDKERRAFDRRTREGHSRISNARVNDEDRAEQTQMRVVELNERNIRNSRVVRVELRGQRDTELRGPVSTVHRDSVRISEDRMREARDESTSIVRGIYTSNNERIDERRQQRDDSRRSSMDTLRERNTAGRRLGPHQTSASRSLEIAARNDKRMKQRQLLMGRLSKLRESHDVRDESSDEQRLHRDVNHHKIEPRQESRIFAADRDKKEKKKSSEERRLRRDNSRLSRDMKTHEDQDNTKRESLNDVRKNLGERRQQRDNHRHSRDRTISMLRENREVRENERTQDPRRIVSPSGTEMFSRNSRSRQDNERSDLRRLVLERSMERVIQMAHDSISAERRDDNRKTSRASESAESSRVREDTRSNERDEHRQTRDQGRNLEHRVNRNVATPQRFERVVRNRYDVRESSDRDRTVERNIVQRVTHIAATPQRLETRRFSRTESIRLVRLVRNRIEVEENERKEMQRDDDRTPSILLNRRSSEMLFAERRQEKREARDSQNARMTRNQVKVRSEKVLAERRQENRETASVSRTFREETRKRGEVKSERVFADRRQENREATRDSRNVRGEIKSEMVLADRRQENRETNSRDVLYETRHPGEVRGEKILAERRQENREVTRDSRNFRGEIRMDERLDSRRHRDASKESRTLLQRKSRDTERFTERLTRNIERQVRFDRNLRTADASRESSRDIRANNYLAMERIDRTANRLTQDVRNDANEGTRFRNIDVVTFRDTLYSVEKSNESVFINWQTIFYTLQGIYLCGLLVQLLTENTNKTKTR